MRRKRLGRLQRGSGVAQALAQVGNRAALGGPGCILSRPISPADKPCSTLFRLHTTEEQLLIDRAEGHRPPTVLPPPWTTARLIHESEWLQLLATKMATSF